MSSAVTARVCGAGCPRRALPSALRVNGPVLPTGPHVSARFPFLRALFLFISWFSKFNCHIGISRGCIVAIFLELLQACERGRWGDSAPCTRTSLIAHTLRDTSSTYHYFRKLTAKISHNKLKTGKLAERSVATSPLYYDEHLAGGGGGDDGAESPSSTPGTSRRKCPSQGISSHACSEGGCVLWEPISVVARGDHSPRGRRSIPSRTRSLLSGPTSQSLENSLYFVGNFVTRFSWK